MSQVKAILLDFGNTIIDEKPFIRGAQMGFVRFVKAKLNLADSDDNLFAKLSSTPWPASDHPLLQEIKDREYYGRMLWGLKFAEACGVGIDDSTGRAMLEAYDQGAKCSDCLIGNVAGTLATLAKHYKLGIVSNGYSGFINATLEHYNLKRFFASVIISQDVNIQKPDGKIYDLALAACGVRDSEALMVGDSYLADVWGAKIHGLRACWVNPDNTSYTVSVNSALAFLKCDFRQQPKPTGREHDFTIKEIDELPDVLGKHKW